MISVIDGTVFMIFDRNDIFGNSVGELSTTEEKNTGSKGKEIFIYNKDKLFIRQIFRFHAVRQIVNENISFIEKT